MAEKKVGQITIWVNVFKKDEAQPDYRGKMDLEGYKYNISTWIDQEQSGTALRMSGQITIPAEEYEE